MNYYKSHSAAAGARAPFSSVGVSVLSVIGLDCHVRSAPLRSALFL